MSGGEKEKCRVLFMEDRREKILRIEARLGVLRVLLVE